MDESAKIDSVSRCNEGICGKPIIATNVLYEHLAEIEREGERGRGGKKGIYGMREGEREVKLGREEISYNREKRVPFDSSQSRNCTNSSLAI